MSNRYTGHWTCRVVRNPDTQARLDEEAALRAQVRDLDAAAPDDVRCAGIEVYHETYADHTARGAKPLDAMIAALQARLGVLEHDGEAQAQRKRAWRAFVNVMPLLSLNWWDMAVFWSRFEVASVFWRDLADELEALAEDAEYTAHKREEHDLLAGL